MKKILPNLEEFRLNGTSYPVVDPSTLPVDILAALDGYMRGRTVSHPVYIYMQDWVGFCGAVERGDISI
ncbi:hypothetical protein AB6D24_12235 [Vibrio splendidus]|uniref:hypothetical protein n=1 Tax=Vibrio sp. F13 TaxID=2070777 RepID=UPI0010BDE064|nr:hypothetical protein [Vibrio sp. F13]TKG05346.1 hypothetical protein FCV76_01360 [Vibrio sp. F13]